MTVAQSYLKQHMAILHIICVLQTKGVDKKMEGPTTYVVYCPRILQSVICLVLGCPTRAHSAERLQEHFMFRHFWSQIVVIQEIREPLPRCDMYGMHMPEGWFIKHHQTARCDRNKHMMWWRGDVEITAKFTGATFSLTGDDGAECF